MNDKPWLKNCPKCNGTKEILVPIFGDPNLGYDTRTCNNCDENGKVQKHATEN